MNIIDKKKNNERYWYKIKNKMFILSDERFWLKCWIVFEVISDNLVKEVFRHKYKKNCINWIKNH